MLFASGFRLFQELCRQIPDRGRGIVFLEEGQEATIFGHYLAGQGFRPQSGAVMAKAFQYPFMLEAEPAPFGEEVADHDAVLVELVSSRVGFDGRPFPSFLRFLR